MKLIIVWINNVLFIVLAILVVLGLILIARGNDNLATDVLLAAAIIVPIFLAAKGIEFAFENQLRKAFMSILLLSVVCLLSILFVFV
jgi:uncharacterized membrane protein YozB (DUF420 family)